MRQQVQGEEEFPDEAQSRDCVEVVYNMKYLVLLMKTTSEDLSNTYKDGKMSCCRGTYLRGCKRL
jgi:hypothetical protein